MKKDGLLGGVFLDESEMEEILNEFGKAGWELISMLDTRDGVVGVFKQPLLEELQTKPYVPRQQDEPPAAMPASPSNEKDAEPGLTVYEQLEEESAVEEPEDHLADGWETVEEESVESEPELTKELDEEPPEDDDTPDVGSIRIE